MLRLAHLYPMALCNWYVGSVMLNNRDSIFRMACTVAGVACQGGPS